MRLPAPPFDDGKRLLVMILVEKHQNIVFSDLARAMKVSKGALFTILRPLEELGYIEKIQVFKHQAPRVIIRATFCGLQELHKARENWRELLDKKSS